MIKKRLCGICLAICMALALAIPGTALDDDEFEGYAADTLTIKVGYFGGPYYEKAVFTLDELWAMDVVYADYTFIDNMPSVCIDHVAGVRLSDLMDAAGIDLNSIQTFYFWTWDKTSDYFTSYSKASLIDTPRYCYYSLPDNYNDEEGIGNEYATSYGVLVDTVLALADDWNRCIAGASFGSDYMNLNVNTRFRLIFGQTDAVTHTASRSAKWIHEIVVELGGAPVLTLDASVLEGEVGSILRTEVGVTADSAVIANEAITWSSSDESVATVDAEGNITVHGEGTAVITASFAGVTASVTVNGTPGEGGGTSDGPAEPDGDNSETGPSEPEAGDTSDTQAEQQAEIAPPSPPDTSAENTPPETESQPITPSETEQTETVLQKLTPFVITGTEVGGVQNWRKDEMSNTAVALPNIEPDVSVLWTLGISAGILFVASGIVYAAIFYQSIGRKQNVYKSK